jgi:membrane associated rhomboid family serine protease
MPFDLQDLDYLFAFSPLVLAHVVVPPISRVRGFRQNELTDESLKKLFQIVYKYITPSELWNYKNIKSLMLDPDKLGGERIITLLTYMFIHGDYHHLLGNLFSLFFCGSRVHREFGAIGLYNIFLTSGLVCQIPSFIRSRQDETKPFLVKMWHVVIPPLSCGSSGGVCGVLGANVALVLWDVISNLQGLSSTSRPVEKGGVLTTRRSNAKVLLGSLLMLWGPCATLFTIAEEWRDVNTVGFGIDNAAHLQGFVFGGLVALAAKTLFAGF